MCKIKWPKLDRFNVLNSPKIRLESYSGDVT